MLQKCICRYCLLVASLIIALNQAAPVDSIVNGDGNVKLLKAFDVKDKKARGAKSASHSSKSHPIPPGGSSAASIFFQTGLLILTFLLLFAAMWNTKLSKAKNWVAKQTPWSFYFHEFFVNFSKMWFTFSRLLASQSSAWCSLSAAFREETRPLAKHLQPSKPLCLRKTRLD